MQPNIVREARDPHHNGDCHWGWDGLKLYHRSVGQSRWTEVRRIHPTPKRLAVLVELMREVPRG